MDLFLTVLWVATFVVTPSFMIWGWVRWLKSRQPRTAYWTLSWIGFSLATASALLAISTLIYAHAIGGFPFYDPRLLRIYRWGALLSLVSIIFAVGGIWRAGPGTVACRCVCRGNTPLLGPGSRR